MTYSFLKQTTAAFGIMISADAALAETSRTIASYPSGTFLENLSQGPDGSVLVTSYLDRTVLRWTGEGILKPLLRSTAIRSRYFTVRTTSC